MSVLIATLWLLSGQATPALDRQCQDDRGVNRCAAEQQARVRAVFDVPAAEALREQGVTARRAFAVDGYGRDMPVVTFARALGDDPRLNVRVRRPAGRQDRGQWRVEEMTAPVPLSTWNAVLRRTRYADRGLQPRAQDRGADTTEVVSICGHSWGGTVELIEPGPSEYVRSRTDSGCDDSPTRDAVFFLADTAVELLPPCAALDREHQRNSLTILQTCAMLEGDRLAAAEAYNVLNAPWLMSPNADSAAAIRGRFDYRAELNWAGERASGSAEIATVWARRLSTPGVSFYPARVVGESADRAVVHGDVWRQLDLDAERPTYEIAPVTMILERRLQPSFAIHTVSVEPAERHEPPPSGP